MSLLSEFKAFALRGNVVDLAVGVIIGAAFGKIVTSLVDNIAGVKDATANVVRVSQQRAAMGEGFNQLSGEDATALGFMAHGGHDLRLVIGHWTRPPNDSANEHLGNALI